MIPITILTGFLGAGKTTLVNQILTQNPDIRFGLIVNEFGQVGIDGQIVVDSGQEMVELSNGCMCCIVRSDLYQTVETLINTGKVDYILIEASGLAEPKPIADTFIMNNLNGRIALDAIICVVDVDNYNISQDNYKVAVEQIEFCDIIILNKVTAENQTEMSNITKLIGDINPAAVILDNTKDFDTRVLIEKNRWPIERLTEYQREDETEHQHSHSNNDNETGGHSHHHHGHEHDDVDEVVFTSDTAASFDPDRLDSWLKNQFPPHVVRAKGIINLKTPKGNQYYVFQMVGASKSLAPFEKATDFSRMVLIGKDLDREAIIKDLKACLN